MSEYHTPTVGSVIVNANTKEIMGYWGARRPELIAGLRIRVPLRMKATFTPTWLDYPHPSLEASANFFEVWMAYGVVGKGFQVWETTAESSEDLKRIWAI